MADHHNGDLRDDNLDAGDLDDTVLRGNTDPGTNTDLNHDADMSRDGQHDDTVLRGAVPDKTALHDTAHDDTVLSKASLNNTALGDTVLGASALRDSELDDTVLVELARDDTFPDEATPADDATPFEETELRGRRTRETFAEDDAPPVASCLGAPPISYGIRQAPPQTPIERVDFAASLPVAVLPASARDIHHQARKKARRRAKLLVVAMVLATAVIAIGVVYCVIVLLNA